MTATVKSYELIELSDDLRALASLDSQRASMNFSPEEIDLVIEHRRAKLVERLAKRDIKFVRVANPESTTVDAAAIPLSVADPDQVGE